MCLTKCAPWIKCSQLLVGCSDFVNLFAYFDCIKQNWGAFASAFACYLCYILKRIQFNGTRLKLKVYESINSLQRPNATRPFSSFHLLFHLHLLPTITRWIWLNIRCNIRFYAWISQLHICTNWHKSSRQAKNNVFFLYSGHEHIQRNFWCVIAINLTFDFWFCCQEEEIFLWKYMKKLKIYYIYVNKKQIHVIAMSSIWNEFNCSHIEMYDWVFLFCLMVFRLWAIYMPSFHNLHNFQFMPEVIATIAPHEFFML